MISSVVYLVAPAVALLKLRTIEFAVVKHFMEWTPFEWLSLLGLTNQICSITDVDEHRKAAMLRLLLTPHETAAEDAHTLQQRKLEIFETSLVEALLERVREQPKAPPRLKYTLSASGDLQEEMEEVEPEPENSLSDDDVLRSEVEPLSAGIAVVAVLAMISDGLATILMRGSQSQPKGWV